MKKQIITLICVFLQSTYSLTKNPNENQTNILVIISKDSRLVKLHQKQDQNVVEITQKQFDNCKAKVIKINITSIDGSFSLYQQTINIKKQSDEFLIPSYFEVESIDGFCQDIILNIQIIPTAENNQQTYQILRKDNQQDKLVTFQYKITAKNFFNLVTIGVVNLRSNISGYIEQTFLSYTGQVLFASKDKSNDIQPLIPSTFLNYGLKHTSISVYNNKNIKYVVYPKDMEFRNVNLYIVDTLIANKIIQFNLKVANKEEQNLTFQQIVNCKTDFNFSNINFEFIYNMQDELSNEQSISYVKDYRSSQSIQEQGLLVSTIIPNEEIQCEVNLNKKSNSEYQIHVNFTQQGVVRNQQLPNVKSVLKSLKLEQINENDEIQVHVQDMNSEEEQLLNQKKFDMESMNNESILKGSINSQQDVRQKTMVNKFNDRPQVQSILKQKQSLRKTTGQLESSNTKLISNKFSDRPNVKSILEKQSSVSHSTDLLQNSNRKTLTNKFSDRQYVKQIIEKKNSVSNSTEQLSNNSRKPMSNKFSDRPEVQNLQKQKNLNVNNLKGLLDGDILIDNQPINQNVQQKKQFEDIDINQAQIQEQKINSSQNENLSNTDNNIQQLYIILNNGVQLQYNNQQIQCSTSENDQTISQKKKIQFFIKSLIDKEQVKEIIFSKPFKKNFYKAFITDQQVKQELQQLLNEGEIKCELLIKDDVIIFTALTSSNNYAHVTVEKNGNKYHLMGQIKERHFRCVSEENEYNNPIFQYYIAKDTATDQQNQDQQELVYTDIQIGTDYQKFLINDIFRDECLYSCNFDTSLLKINENFLNIRLVETCALNAEYISIKYYIRKQAVLINVIKQNVALNQEIMNKIFIQDFTDKQKDKLFLLTQDLQSTQFEQYDYESYEETHKLLFFKAGTNILNQYGLKQKLIEFDQQNFMFIQLNEQHVIKKTNMYYIIKFQNNIIKIQINFKDAQKDKMINLKQNIEEDNIDFVSNFNVHFTIEDPQQITQSIDQKIRNQSDYYTNILTIQNEQFNIFNDFEITQLERYNDNIYVKVNLKIKQMI